MKDICRIRALFVSAVITQLITSATVLFMPLAARLGEDNRAYIVVTGLVFWLFFITGCALCLVAEYERKLMIKRRYGSRVKMDMRPGIISFFSNIPATVADVAAAASAIALAVLKITERSGYIAYVLIFILLFSFYMHCMFNGRIYKTIKIKTNSKKERKTL